MKRAILLMLAGLGLMGAMIPSAKAAEKDQEAVFTFTGPVEIPGQVLPAGTYVFKLADPQTDESLVQVFDKSESHLYGTFLTLPDSHLSRQGTAAITFEERPSGAPEALKAWFYPGDKYGHEFVYGTK